MATKYDPEKDFVSYQELAKEASEIDDQIAGLLAEKQKINSKIESHVEKARNAITFDTIKTAAHEFQVEILNEITMAVIESNDLEKAVKLIDHLETHLEARLRLALKKEGKELPPSLSPAIAARRQKAQTPEKQTHPKADAKAQPKADTKTGAKPSATPVSTAPPPRGLLAERRTVMSDRVTEICRYEYEGDKLSRMVFFDPANNPLRTHQLIYDNDGRIVQEIHIDRAGVTLQVHDREYNDQGKITKETMRNAHNDIQHTIDFKYDRHGRLVKKQWRDSRGGKTKAWDYKYEKDSPAPAKIIWRDERNKPYVFVELRYDDKGHILEEISKDKTGAVIRSVKYQYFY